MEHKDKQNLKRQLELQAKAIAANADPMELIPALLTTCSALLRTAEQLIPSDWEGEALETVYAGYLGVTSRVEQFAKTNHTLLRQRTTALERSQQERNQLDAQLTQIKGEQHTLNQEIKSLKKRLASATSRFQTAQKEQAELEAQAQEMERERERLETEHASLRQQMERFEPDLERMTQEVEQAKECYQDLVASYVELERVQAGIAEEGFVDMNSFTQAMADRNQQGEALMKDYQRILGNLLADVEGLQQRIKERRRPGAGT